MYEPIRTKSVRPPRPPSLGRKVPPGQATASTSPPPQTAAAGTPAQPPRLSRAEHLDAQLAGHLAALLTVTDALRHTAPSAELDEAARHIADRIAALSPQGAPALIWEGSHPREGDQAGQLALHERAHLLAGRVLVVAASRQDTATAMLACLRMDAHAQALKAAPVAA